MVFVAGTVYEPPTPDFPVIVVFFDAQGDIRVIRAVASAEAGKTLLEKMQESFAHLGLAELKIPAQDAETDAS